MILCKTPQVYLCHMNKKFRLELHKASPAAVAQCKHQNEVMQRNPAAIEPSLIILFAQLEPDFKYLKYRTIASRIGPCE